MQIKLKWLCILAFLNNVGYSCVWPLTTIYMHNELHESLITVGIVLLFYSLSNVLGSYVAGILFDKTNTFHLNVVGQLITLISIVWLIFENSWPAYPILLCIFGFGTGWILTIINALATKIRKYDSVAVFNTLYLVENVGLVVGAAITGFLYKIGIAVLFLVISILYIFSSTIVLLVFKKINVNYKYSSNSEHSGRIEKMNRSNYILIFSLLFGLIIIWIMYEQWMSNLSIYMLSLNISTEKYSLLWTLNGVLIVVFQLIVSFVGRFVKTLYFQICFGTLAISVSFVILLYATKYQGFILAMIVLTLGEALVVPAVPAIVSRLSAYNVKGKYQGYVNAFSSTGRALGPLVGGMIIENISYIALFKIGVVSNLILFFVYVSVITITKPHVNKFLDL